MKIRSLISVASVLLGSLGFCQSMEVSEDMIESGIGFANYGGILMGKALPAPEVEGDPYLFEDFTLGNIYLKSDKKLSNQEFNFDIYNDLVLVEKPKGFYSFNLNYVSAFETLNNKYINTSKYGLSGFSRVLYEGENVKLVKHQYLYIKDPTYIEGVDTGSRNIKIYKMEDLYLIKGDKSIELKKKSDLREAFKDDQEIYNFIKENKLKPKKEEELVDAFEELGI